jgi:3-(3-hydroxy-phenyl)propionate hydroxylase
VATLQENVFEGMPVAPVADNPREADRCDVIIVGAGPVGLHLGNTLGAAGLKVVILEALTALIDYPRGVGMDDESLRSFQAIGLVEQIRPHTTPFFAMRFVNGKGRMFASIEPMTDEFGWPRRNAFIQPLIDRILADGLARYPNVQLHFGQTVSGFVQDEHGVSVSVNDGKGAGRQLRGSYLLGCDGGRSLIRKDLQIPFVGSTDPNRWIVVDIADDPMGLPNAYMHADPARPYASIALPHGIRRLEFMLFPGEGEDGEVPREVLNSMLARVIPEPERINLIRARIYTHNGRLAERFRGGRVLLAGDAAHIMPVWQGQGFNSGIRDALNLGWKVALAAKGICGDRLLDTYQAERREHAKAMIALSETAGKIIAMRNPLAVLLRDAFTYVANYLPPVKRYFLEMRFKPMPRYKTGAIYYGPKGFAAESPVGRMFIQPQVALAEGWQGRLDDALGSGFALLSWGVNPLRWLDPDVRRLLDTLATKYCWVVPMTQLAYEAVRTGEVTVLGDVDMRLKQWFGRTPNSVVLLRPDRFVALNCGPLEVNVQVRLLAEDMQVSSRPVVMPAVAAGRAAIG